MSGKHLNMSLSVGLLFFLRAISACVSADFAWDSFVFEEVELGEGDKQYIENSSSDRAVLAYRAPGAFVPFLRDGSEYGHCVGQVRIYSTGSGKLYCLYSDIVSFEDRRDGRGDEVSWGEIRYPSECEVSVELVWRGGVVGAVVVDLKTENLRYVPIDSVAEPGLAETGEPGSAGEPGSDLDTKFC